MNDIAVRSKNISLLDALDRVLEKGVVVDGDVYLSVAGIELVYLKLKLLLASTATVERFTSNRGPQASVLQYPAPEGQSLPVRIMSGREQHTEQAHEILTARVLSDNEASAPNPGFQTGDSRRVDINPKKVEEGLAKLVLTLVELLRKLMERQALRRVELGTLTDKEIDSVGEAFMRLDEKMKELKKIFGLEDTDLNLDLGPVGDLI